MITIRSICAQKTKTIREIYRANTASAIKDFDLDHVKEGLSLMIRIPVQLWEGELTGEEINGRFILKRWSLDQDGSMITQTCMPNPDPENLGLITRMNLDREIVFWDCEDVYKLC